MHTVAQYMGRPDKI